MLVYNINGHRKKIYEKLQIKTKQNTILHLSN